ncbi:cobaltochelatase subunit CobN [Mycolicibacterium poriferae]|uniref:cobaltochelatase subunit CobN n=1 Tax=Mycolicibacterium poriferae TaxID=39694 RepID=UPI0024BA1736|nr:cobaltochelatase subunit CobN [Mycolicibacterium poriferae]
MNLARSLTGLAFAPVRAGLAVADAGITVATGALDLAHRTVGEEKDGVRTGRPTSMAQVLGIEDAVERANRLARLMDEAVQRVKVLEEAENYVRRHYLATRAALIDLGYSEEDADRRAGVRIFDEPPGIFNLNTSGIVAASGTWDSDQGMADEYLSKMGHGYGNGFWGEPMMGDMTTGSFTGTFTGTPRTSM